MKARCVLASHHLLRVAGYFAVCVGVATPVFGQEPAPASSVDLFHQPLEVWDGGEAILTRFDLPAGFELAKHTHPGEEFVYVTEGSATVVIEGQADSLVEAGEGYWIPMGAIHTAVPGPDGVKGVVFRIHPLGEPVREDVE